MNAIQSIRNARPAIAAAAFLLCGIGAAQAQHWGPAYGHRPHAAPYGHAPVPPAHFAPQHRPHYAPQYAPQHAPQYRAPHHGGFQQPQYNPSGYAQPAYPQPSYQPRYAPPAYVQPPLPAPLPPGRMARGGAPVHGFGAPAPGFASAQQFGAPAPTPMAPPALGGFRPNPELQMAAQCATTGDPYSAAACTASRLTQAELDKCRNGIGNSGGCFGPGNTLRQAAETVARDVTHGPGQNNDLFGSNGFVARTFGSALPWPF
jgi:hypothetical protein